MKPAAVAVGAEMAMAAHPRCKTATPSAGLA